MGKGRGMACASSKLFLISIIDLVIGINFHYDCLTCMTVPGYVTTSALNVLCGSVWTTTGIKPLLQSRLSWACITNPSSVWLFLSILHCMVTCSSMHTLIRNLLDYLLESKCIILLYNTCFISSSLRLGYWVKSSFSYIFLPFPLHELGSS
jgi:hypothetical protein